MESLLFALNAVLPIVFLVAIGYLLKRIGIIGADLARGMNKLVFRLFLPTMLFLNVYKIENLGELDFGYILYGSVAVLIIFLVSIPLVMAFTKDNSQRSILLQATYRSNYALIGIPLATSLFGEEGAIIATVFSAITIPLFNILAVISMSVFSNEKKKISIKNTLLEIVKNPLIQGIFAGAVVLLIREVFGIMDIGFRLADVKPIYQTLTNLSNVATPLALIVIGAQFELSAIPKLKRSIIFGTCARTVITPALGITVAYFIGCFSGAHFATFIALFGTPIAVSTVPMAQEMGADSALAGQLVVWTTITSALTIFLASFILKSLGVFG